MRASQRLPSVLEMLDEGLRVYRRSFAGFVLVSLAVLAGIAMLAITFMAFVRSELGDSELWIGLGMLVVLLLGYPLLVYAMAALSRAAEAALDGRPIALGQALRLHPLRGCGMLVFNALFAVLSAVIVGIIGSSVSCPITYASLMAGALLSTATASNSMLGAVMPLLTAIGVASWLLSVGFFGAWLMCVVYALQAWVLERRSWGASAGRAFEVVTARFGHTLLLFLGAGLLFGTLSLTYLGSLLGMVALLAELTPLDVPELLRDGIVVALVVGSLALLLPPLAIWNVLFFRRVSADRDGGALERRIAAWRAEGPTALPGRPVPGAGAQV